MHQIDDAELLFILRFELSRIPKSVARDLQSGHQGTHRQGVEYVARRLEKRMEDWEIILPDGLGRPYPLPTSGQTE